MLLDDVATITTLPKDALVKLVKRAEYCISDSIVEQVLQGKDIIEIDITIGKILLKLIDDEVKYKFIPSDEFKDLVKQSMNGHNTLSDTLEKNLVTKVTKAYKDLL